MKKRRPVSKIGNLNKSVVERKGKNLGNKQRDPKPGGDSPGLAVSELLLQAADKFDQALDLVVSQFAFELRHLVLAFLGDFEQVGV